MDTTNENKEQKPTVVGDIKVWDVVEEEKKKTNK